MYKFTLTEYLCDPWHMDTQPAQEHRVCFSTSPKRACKMGGATARSRTGGAAETPVMASEKLEHNGKVIFDRWVD